MKNLVILMQKLFNRILTKASHLKENIREEDEHPIGIYRAQRPKAARIYSVNDFFFSAKQRNSLRMFSLLWIFPELSRIQAK